MRLSARPSRLLMHSTRCNNLTELELNLAACPGHTSKVVGHMHDSAGLGQALTPAGIRKASIQAVASGSLDKPLKGSVIFPGRKETLSNNNSVCAALSTAETSILSSALVATFITALLRARHRNATHGRAFAVGWQSSWASKSVLRY